MSAKFTIPKLVKYDDDSKPWYVYFRYEKKLFRYKFSLNYIKNLSEREHEFREVCKILLSKLNSGWNPNIKDHEAELSEYTLNEALDFALAKKKPNVSLKTYQGYSGTVRFIKSSVIDLNLKNLKVIEVKRVHIKLILEKTIELRKWSNKAHNKHLGYLKAILSELIQWDIIETNPAFNVKSLPETESDANVPASLADIDRIRKELSTNHKSFYVFVITIFHTGIRPAEILKLKLIDVNLKAGEITLSPDITKTNKKRIVPINKYLLKFYKEMDFESLPKEYYLFGTFRTPKKIYKKTEPDFIPGPRKVSRCTATRRWESIVKLGLKIDMNLYAMKHYGADQKILAGLPLDTLRELYGHSSTLMTEKYAKKVKEVYRRQIMDQSPDF
jgi:integrase